MALHLRMSWLLLASTVIIVLAATQSDLGAQPSSYRLQTSVMGAAGSPGAGGAVRCNGTMAQPAPIGVGSSSGQMLYAGFWSRPWVLSSVLGMEDALSLTNCIYQNFPNPFTHSTTIAYSVAKESRVEISVFNVRGQRVATLVNEQVLPGRYVTSWDGKSESGDEASPGVYLCRMTVADYQSARKMLFLR